MITTGQQGMAHNDRAEKHICSDARDLSTHITI